MAQTRTKVVSCLEVFSIKQGLGPTSNNGLGVLGSINLKLYKWIFPLLHCIAIATSLSEFFKSALPLHVVSAQIAFVSTFSL